MKQLCLAALPGNMIGGDNDVAILKTLFNTWMWGAIWEFGGVVPITPSTFVTTSTDVAYWSRDLSKGVPGKHSRSDVFIDLITGHPVKMTTTVGTTQLVIDISSFKAFSVDAVPNVTLPSSVDVLKCIVWGAFDKNTDECPSETISRRMLVPILTGSG